MTYFRDLTPCDYGASFSGLTHVVAVGWLEPPFEFPRGLVNRATRDRLQTLLSARWALSSAFGSHACRFCAEAAGIDGRSADFGLGELPRGSANILIPGRDVVYAAPELILHYIDAHQYCPPAAFARAVRVCPPMQSKRYFLALMTTGGEMPAFVEELRDNAARQVVTVWRSPLRRAWHRIVRGIATGPRVLREPLLNEWAAEREARKAKEFPRQRVVDFLQRISSSGLAAHEEGDEFVLPHPDGEIHICPIGVRWVVRRKKGKVLYAYGAATNEIELEQLLASALMSIERT